MNIPEQQPSIPLIPYLRGTEKREDFERNWTILLPPQADQYLGSRSLVSGSVTNALNEEINKDGPIKAFCKSPVAKLALKIAAIVIITAAISAVVATPFGLATLSIVVIGGLLGLGILGLYETRQYAKKHFSQSLSDALSSSPSIITFEDPLLAQLRISPTLKTFITLLEKASSIEQIQDLIKEANTHRMPQDVILYNDLESMIATPFGRPVDFKEIKSFLLRYIKIKEQIHQLKTAESHDPSFEEQFKTLMTTHITRFTPHQQIAIPHDLEDTLAIIEAAEPMVSQFSESKIGAELKIKELRNTICEMTPENRQKFHKIATYFRKSFDLEKPITVKDIEEQLLDIRGILFHPPVTIDPHIITLLNEGEKILTSNETFRTNKLALDKLDALLNLANNPELLETLNDRKTYIERSNYRQDQHLRQHTLSMIAFRDAFESSPGAAQEFEDKLYADILSLLNTPNFRNIRDRLEPSYPPRENQ